MTFAAAGVSSGGISRTALVLLAILVLLPSAYLAWQYRDMPQLGIHHDDALYWVTAKSLAENRGYRIISLPGEPYQTKYPPGYAWTLSQVWRIQPSSPDNLKLAALFAWIMLPGFVLGAAALWSDLGLSRIAAAALAAVAALHPVTVTFSLLLMSELPGCLLFFAALLVAERAGESRRGPVIALGAGLLGGLAYLTRAAALPLLATAPLCFLARRKYREAASFTAGMLPAVLGWRWWIDGHAVPAGEPVLGYYTSYSWYQWWNFGWPELPELVWRNAGAFLAATGDLVMFRDSDAMWRGLLTRLAALAAVAGAVRLARRTGRLQYPAFAAAFTVLLLVWHYPPTERFLLPLAPLLLAAFWVELRAAAGLACQAMLRPKRADRVAGILVLALVAGFGLFALSENGRGLARAVPEMLQASRRQAAASQTLFQWIERNTPPHATVLAYRDPLLFLNTGRRAFSVRIPPKLLYTPSSSASLQFGGLLREAMDNHRPSLILATPQDFELESHTIGRAALADILSKSGIRLLHRLEAGAVYQVDRTSPDSEGLSSLAGRR